MYELGAGECGVFFNRNLILNLPRQNNKNAASSGPEQVNVAGFCAWKLAFLAVGGKRGTVLGNG